MKFTRRYARWNRAVTNKAVRLWAGWVPAMGLLTHVGRKSGNQYRTPLNIFPTSDGYAVLLPYGPTTTEWLKNLRVAGGGELVHCGKSYHVTDPLITTRHDSIASVHRPWRILYSKAPFNDALLLHAERK
ncbi:MAG TPA: nitroreductase family deazaflavin-dependent oxidoreductase [Mycobacterium sp.]